MLTGLLIWLEAGWTRFAFGPAAGDPEFILIVCLVNTGLAMLVTRMLWGLRLSAARLWAWAAAPLLVLYVGHNWDLLAVAFAVAAFAAAEQGKPVKACALAALGAAAKLFPVVLLPLFALRRLVSGKIAEVMVLAGAAIAAWLAVNIPVLIAAPENWWQFYRFSSDRAGTRASIWEILGSYGLLQTDIPTRNVLSLLAFVIGFCAILALGWKRYSERLWLLAAPVVLWFLLTSKVYSPQFDLWPYAFILVTARRWQPIALFVAGDFAAYFAELWFFSGQEGGWPSASIDALAFAALVRAWAMLWLISDALTQPLPRWMERGETGLPPGVTAH